MTHAKLPTAALLALAISACQQTDNSSFNIDEANTLAPADIETLPPNDAGGAPVEVGNGAGNADEPAPPAGAATIPAQYHGRWGMVPNDCQPGRSDAKGLITIGGTTIRFYESVGTLKEQRPAIATSFSGLFAFTGEGQTWEKVQTLTRTGDQLVRAEEEGNFTYRRC